MRPGKRKALEKENYSLDALTDLLEKIKAGIRAKVEHPFRVLKRQFGYGKVRYRGLKKNTLQPKKSLPAQGHVGILQRARTGGRYALIPCRPWLRR